MLLTISSSESMFEKDESPCKAAERSAQASPSDAMSHPTHRSSSTTEKPFFIMDWLEQVDPKAIALAQQILQTPQKHATPTIKADPSSSLKEVRKDLFTPNPSHFLQRSISIGNGYNAKGIQKARQGDWEKALDCWNNALEIRSQILGESHVDVANTLNNIGIALGKLNRSEEAIVSLHRALEIRIDHYGPEHAEVAATLHNIGNIYQLHGDFEAAIHYFCQCKLLQENIFGSSDNVEVARACIAMGHTYFRAEAFLDAREAYTDALLIFQHIGLPDDDPEVQATIDDIRDLDQNILYRQH
jgi:tetratricopeptide (TPR) repeat protein